MNKLTLEQIQAKHKPNPLFKGLSSKLKDPANFEPTEKRLIEILRTDHKHKTASSYVKCAECQAKRSERTMLMKDIGFKSMAQYLEWKKIMTIIKEKKSFQLR